MRYPVTPDGRYFVVRGRLWRCSKPALLGPVREQLVRELMTARAGVDAVMRALGERGPVWWNDGDRDYNRHLARHTTYAEWFTAHDPGEPVPRPCRRKRDSLRDR
jgi:hypothetical protein